MIQRKCPNCSSELVRARRTDQQSLPGFIQGAIPNWRCSVCGGEFSTEQIRDSKRADAAAASSVYADYKPRRSNCVLTDKLSAIRPEGISKLHVTDGQMFVVGRDRSRTRDSRVSDDFSST